MASNESEKQSTSPLADLNPAQLEAVQHVSGPLLVLAGAGSGKTRVLTRRVANLVLNHGVAPGRILAVTFTNKATDEMRERLLKILGEKGRDVWVSTFHSAGLRILRRHAALLSYSNNFTVYDDQDTKSVLKRVLSELNLNEKKFPPALFARIIDEAKNAFILPEQYKGAVIDGGRDISAAVYAAYQKALLAADAMDFGDLLCNTLLLFQRHPEVLERYQQGLRYVLVDEFQDTNIVQYRIVSLLSAVHKNLFVVGDDDQSIYSFRGANLANVLDFEKEHPGTRVVKLEQNYRSSASILEASHAVIERNKNRKPKKLWTTQAGGELITTYAAEDEYGEAQFIAREVQMQLSGGSGLKDLAIFYRTNAQSRAIEEALIENGIPYRIFGGLKFYERKEIKDILAYLRLTLSELDDQAFLRVINNPPRGIGAQTIAGITRTAREGGISLMAASRIAGTKSNSVRQFVQIMEKLASEARTSPLPELVGKTLEITDYLAMIKASRDVTAQSRLENLLELKAMTSYFTDSSQSHIDNLRGFLDRVALTAASDTPSAETPGSSDDGFVSLMTLHLAKGLEFPVVFLTGLEEGLLPHYRSMGDPTAVEEERRLCYVGITRAMRKLYLTRSLSRGMFGAGDGIGFSGMFRDASRFAFDLPQELIDAKGYDFLLGGAADRNNEDAYDPGVEPESADPSGNCDVMARTKPIRRQRSKGRLGVVAADDLE